MSTIIRIMTHNVWNRDENTPQWEGKGYQEYSDEAREYQMEQLREDRPTPPTWI